MLFGRQSWQGRIEHGLFCEAFATLNVGVRGTITCHDLCNNRAYFEPRRIADAIGVREPRDPSSRNSKAARPPRRAPTRCIGVPFRGADSPTERASRPGASHAAVPFSLLESRPRHIGTHPPFHRPCSGSRRVCSRWRKATMKDKPAADRHASPTLGKNRRFFSMVLGNLRQVPPSPEPTVADLAVRCVSVRFGVRCKPATAKAYKLALDRHILPALGAMPVAEVGPREVAAPQGSTISSAYRCSWLRKSAHKRCTSVLA